jgi:hypothetical protein
MSTRLQPVVVVGTLLRGVRAVARSVADGSESRPDHMPADDNANLFLP